MDFLLWKFFINYVRLLYAIITSKWLTMPLCNPDVNKYVAPFWMSYLFLLVEQRSTNFFLLGTKPRSKSSEITLLCDKMKEISCNDFTENQINTAGQEHVFQWTNKFPTQFKQWDPLSQKETKASGDWRLKGLLRWLKGGGGDKRGQ